MDNLNLLCQTIRFQRTALQNSLAMISAVQQHGEKLLKSTLEQSPWIPGEGKDACLFWAGLWTKNLTGMTDLVDKNLATMERLTSTGEKREAGKGKPPEKPAAGPKEPPSVAAKQATPERKQEATPEKKPSAEKSLKTIGFNISLIADVTPIPHNGPRPKKKRCRRPRRRNKLPWPRPRPRKLRSPSNLLKKKPSSRTASRRPRRKSRPSRKPDEKPENNCIIRAKALRGLSAMFTQTFQERQ